VPLDVAVIDRDVVARMQDLYRDELPLLPGAVEAVRALHACWPLGLASSSNREIIDLALELADLEQQFRVTISSEEVARGKPAPDVYLEAAHRLGVRAAHCAAVGDSSNGLRAAAAAGMSVIAVPNPHYPPEEDALALAACVLGTLRELTPAVVKRAAAG
jgi:HAD superfamily hydrolase (TIGR01509 family)